MRAGVSAGAVGQRGLHRRTGLQRAEHGNGGDGRAGEVRRDVRSNRDQPEHPDIERPLCSARRLQLFAAEVSEAEVEATAGDGLSGGLGMPLDLVSDCGADEVGAVCVETVPHEQIDVAEVDIAEVDGDLLALAASLGP